MSTECKELNVGNNFHSRFEMLSFDVVGAHGDASRDGSIGFAVNCLGEI